MTKGEFSLNKFKSTLVKLSEGIAIAFSGLVAVNTVGTNSHVQAATTAVTINYVPGYSIAVWSNYQGGQLTGNFLKHGTSYKIFATANDAQGNTWYNLGGDQWIMAKYTIDSAKVATASTQAISSSEQAAKNWIANRESGGSYTARNGQYVGKYQLSASYLHGDYSPANQERVADNYVKSRYGSWVNAKNFWLRHGWY